MMKDKVISPDILHKGSADDVLVCRPRIALPLYIDESELKISAGVYPSKILASYSLDEGNRHRFDISGHAQRKCHIGSAFRDIDDNSEEWEKVRAIPYQVAEQSILKNCDKNGLGEIRLDDEVERLFESMPGLRRASSFEFINMADNYFFYRKAHEHVPGTMFIEAARQAVYHHLYSQTGCVRGEVTVTLDELSAKFYAYAELMYPIELVVDVLDHLKADKPGKIFYRVSFYQRGSLFSVVDTNASIIDMGLFKKIRNIFLYADDWYSPINQSWLTCEIINDSGDKAQVDLVGISKGGCITSVPDIGCANVKSLCILYDGSFCFSTNIKHDWRNGEYSAWHFDGSSYDDLYDIGDIVKRGFVQLDAEAVSKMKGELCREEQQ